MAKDYKASGAKKWLILFSFFMLVAVVVVGVILFIPANTYSMIESLQENEENFLFEDEKDKIHFENFTTKITSNATLSYYSNEIQNVEILVQSMSEVLGFYNDYLVFAKNNKTLSNSTKSINKYIANAKDLKKTIASLLEETEKLEVNSDTYLKNSWIDFRKNFTNYLENYYRLYISLSKCYENCFDESFNKNTASSTILGATNDYISVIISDYKILNTNDKKGSTTQGSYSYNSGNKINCFKLFVQNYLVNKSEILQYLYTASIQTKYEKIGKFFTVYNEMDFKNVIKNINDSGISNPYTDVSDEENVFAIVKNFLDRRA